MDILFERDGLRQDCCESKRARKRWGAQMAKKLRKRLDDLLDASDLAQFRLVHHRCHELKGERAGQLAIDLVHPLRLIVEPAEDPRPTHSDGGLDWKRIRAVCVLSVEDYHD